MTVAALGLLGVAPGQSGRQTVSAGEPVAVIEVDVHNGELAITNAAVRRTIYLVDKIDLPAGTELHRSKPTEPFCSTGKGYVDHYGDESLVCASDVDGDGLFDTLSGGRLAAPAKIKPPVGFIVRLGTYTTPSTNPRRLIYLGGSATEARFSYREFTVAGLARPAFTEDLTIPLSTLPVTVTLKGVKMTIYSQSANGIDVDVIR